MAVIGAGVLLAACDQSPKQAQKPATSPAAPATPAPVAAPKPLDFAGRYSITDSIDVVDEGTVEMESHLDVGPTVDGKAHIEVELVFANAHLCTLSGDADVHPEGLLYTEETDPPEEGPFVLEIPIRDGAASFKLDSGPAGWSCGARGSWEGEARVLKKQ